MIQNTPGTNPFEDDDFDALSPSMETYSSVSVSNNLQSFASGSRLTSTNPFENDQNSYPSSNANNTSSDSPGFLNTDKNIFETDEDQKKINARSTNPFIDDSDDTYTFLVSPRAYPSTESSSTFTNAKSNTESKFKAPPSLLLSTDKINKDISHDPSSTPSLLSSPATFVSTGNNCEEVDLESTTNETNNGNSIAKFIETNPLSTNPNDKILPTNDKDLLNKESKSMVDDIMKEAISNVSFKSPKSSPNRKEQLKLNKSSPLQMRITPRKRIKAIFELDPSNQLCADCQTYLNIHGTDEIYLSFHYFKPNGNHSQYPNQPLQNLKGVRMSQMWKNANSTALPLSPTTPITDSANSLPTSSIFNTTTFQMQHATFSPNHLNSPRLYYSVFVCFQCAKAHKAVLKSKRNSEQYGLKCIQSLQEQWNPYEIAYLDENRGNEYVNNILERYMPKLFKERFALKRSHNNNASSNGDTIDDDNRTDNGYKEDEDLQSKLNDGLRLAERKVFVQAKYDILAFILPNGPMTDRPNHKGVEKHGNQRKDKWLTTIGEKELSDTDRRRRALQHHALPSRLVDFFCVAGTNGQLDPSFYASFNDENEMKNQIQAWDDVLLEAQLLDCYPPPKNDMGKDFYKDMSLPDHISKFAFPDGYKPATNHPKPNFLTFVLTLDTGLKLYGSCLRIYDQIFNPNLYKGLQELVHHIPIDTDDPVHIPKALIILSHYPFYDTFRSFLMQLYRISRSPSSPLPLERYIANFTREIPLPPAGKVAIHFGFSDELPMLKIRRPSKNALPLVDFPYRPLFTCLSISNILVVFACLLQESRVVLCSEHYTLLTPISEAFLSLLYPFSWQGCYIPLMPYDMLDVLEAPFPFFIGLHSRFLKNEEFRPHGVVFVDLDEDVVHLGYEEIDPGSRDQTEYGRRTPSLPEKRALKLKEALEECVGGEYACPSESGVKGRITYGDNIFMMNDDREIYAVSLTEEETSKQRFTSVSLTGKKQVPVNTRKRSEVFEKIDFAYQNDEYMIPINNFQTESGQMLSTASPDFEPKKTLRRSKKKTHTNSPSVDEADNFSAGVRSAFLRFFVSIFLNYDKYIEEGEISQTSKTTKNGSSELSENGRFRVTSFLNDLHLSENARAYLSQVLSSQMFERFLEERIVNPEQPDVLFFDESIIVKNNRSKTKNLKAGGKKKPTPFLDDRSGDITEIFHPPPPSNWGLSENNRSHLYREFPKLNPDLFGKIRRPKQWTDKQKRRKLTLPSTMLRHRKALSMLVEANESLRSLQSLGSVDSYPKWVVKVPDFQQRDTEWAIHALAYKNTVENEKEKALSADLLGSAQGILLSTRQKQAMQLSFILKLQTTFRMYRARSTYQRLRSAVIIAQRQRRRVVRVREYGRMLNFFISNITQAQRIARGYLVRNRSRRRISASILLQRSWRKTKHQKYLLCLKENTIKAQSLMRGRRARFGKNLVLMLVINVQAHVRGWLDRTAIDKFKYSRIVEYRKQLVELWRRAFVSLEYRSKFWTVADGFGFMNLGLHEDELVRLWNILGLGNDENVMDSTSGTLNIRSLHGVKNTIYQRFLKVQAKLDLENFVNSDNSVSSSSSLRSNLSFMRKKKQEKLQNNDVEVVFLQDSISSSSVVYTSSSNEHKLVNTPELGMQYQRLKLERLNIYERLSGCSANERLEIYEMFGVSISENKKKQRLARKLWESFDLADKSAMFILGMNEQSKQLGFNAVPSRKGMKRFGISSLPMHKSIFNASKLSNTHAMWVQSLIEKRIKYNLTQTIHAFIDGVQYLLIKVEQQENQISHLRRQQNAVVQSITGQTWHEKRQNFIAKYLNSFDDEGLNGAI